MQNGDQSYNALAECWHVCGQCGALFTEFDTVCPMCGGDIRDVLARAVEQKVIVICQVCKLPNCPNNIFCSYCHNILSYAQFPKKILLPLSVWRFINTILLLGTLFAPWIQNLYSSGPFPPISGYKTILFFLVTPLLPIALSVGLGIGVYIVANTLRILTPCPKDRRWLWLSWMTMLPGAISSTALLLTPYRSWGEYLLYVGLLSSGILEVSERMIAKVSMKKPNSLAQDILKYDS